MLQRPAWPNPTAMVLLLHRSSSSWSVFRANVATAASELPSCKVSLHLQEPRQYLLTHSVTASPVPCSGWQRGQHTMRMRRSNAGSKQTAFLLRVLGAGRHRSPRDHLGHASMQQKYSLSSSVRCSTLNVRTLILSSVPRGRRGFIRLTAAVLRKRLARPRVGELSQPGLARAPPMARAAEGRWD